MSFSSMLEILQEKNKGKIVIIKLGAFYIATGRDATLLHKKLGLKCTCYKNNICKVGIPVASIEKYIPILDRTKYAYVIYDYDKTSMYNMLSNVMYINKITRRENGKESLKIINKIDAELNCQRIFLRIMKKQKWIDGKKFEVSMNKIYEIGKIIGGLAKIYAKNY